MTLRPSKPTTAASARAAASRRERAADTEAILEELRTAAEDRRADLLERLVHTNMCVAEAVAARYRSRGISEDDLTQVAYLALVRAAQNFDPHSGNDFLSYAVPSIRGEVRRYFRDHGWAVRPPRRVQEMQFRLNQATAELANRFGREATTDELADHLSTSLAEVEEGMLGQGCFAPTSLDRPTGGPDGATIGELLGDADQTQEAVEAKVVLGPVVRELGERDRRILMLRFFRDRTQQEIADEIGVTQMQVSRLLARIFGQLRERLSDGARPRAS